MMTAELRDWPLSDTETATYEAMTQAESDTLPGGARVLALIDAPAPEDIEARLARVDGPEIVLQ